MLTDPFAVLGVPLTASHSEIVDRYDAVMQLLAIDQYLTERSQTYAEENRRLVEQAYQILSQDQRAEALKALRHQARQSKPRPNSKLAKTLLIYSAIAVTAFYESAIDDLKLLQYWSLNNVEMVTESLQELNLVFLYIKMGSSGDEGGQAVRVPRSPPPSPLSSEAEAEPDVSIAIIS